MTTNFMLTSATALLITGAASADFIGFENFFFKNSQGNNVVQMFAVFDNADAVVLNIFNADVSLLEGEFIHNDVQVGAGGTWSPNASLDIPGFTDSGNDSYVTIGYGVGAQAATNGTNLDPSFGTGLGGTIPTGAGWFNGNPPNEQVASEFGGGSNGRSGYAVMLGQFVWSDGYFFCFESEIGYNRGAGTEVEFGSDICFPTPGTLALLGLGGCATRRRRG